MPNDQQPNTLPPVVDGWFQILTNAAANRNWLSSIVGALGFFVVLGSLDPEQAKAIVASAQKIMDAFGVIVGESKAILIILWPLVQGLISGVAGNSASLGNILKWLGSGARKQAGIVVVAPPAIANAVPPTTVIASDQATVVATPNVAAAVVEAAPAAPVISTSTVAAHPSIVQK